MKAKTPTISDVAKRAGVSPMTVSRVINGENNVRDATREAVNAAIKELNYVPNISARALAGNRSYKLALLYGNPSAFYLSELLVGALEEISLSGHQLLVHKVAETDSQKEILKALRSIIGVYDGVIVPPPLGDYAEVRDFIVKNDLPAVFLSGAEGRGRSCKICIDEFEAGREITEYLIGLGHERIGIVKGHPNQFASEERYRGFCDAMEAAGISIPDSYKRQGYFTFDSGRKAAEELLRLAKPPTAIFACNDDMAAATLAVAASKGIDVPKDLSVVGFDDSPLAASVFPRLTTVRQPLSDMASEAINYLLDFIRSGSSEAAEKPARVVMPYEIVMGKSTAKV